LRVAPVMTPLCSLPPACRQVCSAEPSGAPEARFIRNAHGSHNPDEAMALEDFVAATRVLTKALIETG
jgi:hypothetical protein